MSGIKVSIIGAGSGTFTMAMIKDICLTPSLFGSTINFMDINEDRLDDVYEMCGRIINETGAGLKLEKTTDRRRSLEGADFVINTALQDGSRRLKEGWEVAQKHGIRFGGSPHIMFDEAFWINFHQIRLYESIVGDMLQVCPEAWLLMVANPVLAGSTFLFRKYPWLKAVGLCDGYMEVNTIADVLGLSRERLTYEIPGINHFVWITHLFHDGQDVFPMIDQWLATEAEDYWKADVYNAIGVLGIKSMNLYKRFGVIPVGDTAALTGTGWPWWHHTDEEMHMSWGKSMKEHWYGYTDRLIARPEKLKQLLQGNNNSFIDRNNLKHTGMPMIPIIESITCDIPRVIIANIQNTDEFVPGVPRDFEVEIPTLVSKLGIRGIKTNGLPKPMLIYLLRDRVAPVEMELEAYEKRSRDLLVQMVMMDKWVQSEKSAMELVDEICSLPCMKGMDEYYV